MNKDFSYLHSSKITDSIYLGSYSAAQNKQKLQMIGITHILVAGKYLTINFPYDFVYTSFDVEDYDQEEISTYFEAAYKFIDDCVENGGKILVHCAAGISRSSTFVICYLIKKLQITFEEALKIVQAGREIACPNTGFRKQLQIWYESEVIKKSKSQEIQIGES